MESDRFLPVDEDDARVLIAVEWTWLLGARPVTPLRLTIWGDWFLEDDRTGEVLFLHTGLAMLETVAPSRAAFHERLRDPARLPASWFNEDELALLRRLGQVPGPGECYSWILNPCLGGPLHVENVECRSIGFHQRKASRLGYISRRLPDDERLHAMDLFQLAMDTFEDHLRTVDERLAVLLLAGGVA